MKKFFTDPRLRALAALLFFLLFLLGLAVHTGWGTASSFGIAEIAAICPLGNLEAMLASKTFLPRALVGFAVFLAAAVLLGRFFCGWLCPVPWVEKALAKLRAAAVRVDGDERVFRERQGGPAVLSERRIVPILFLPRLRPRKPREGEDRPGRREDSLRDPRGSSRFERRLRLSGLLPHLPGGPHLRAHGRALAAL